MSCAIAALNSPVFSPSPRVSSIFSNPLVSSPLSRTRHSSSPLSASPPPSSPSPLSPLALRLRKQQSCFSRISIELEPECSTSSAPSTTTLQKRKRPPRISIPTLSLSFGSVVGTPRDADELKEVESEGEGYSAYCKRGRRGPMEDRYSAVVDLHGDSKQAFFGVFDGHGGAKAAEFAAKNIDRNIMNEVALRSEEGIEEAVREGYLTTDAEFLKQDVKGGTSCVTALIRKGNLIVSNAGDCRAVLSRGGVAEALTIDHRPSREDERERIQDLGGYVNCCRGVWRIQGSLAVSRGIGDRNLKQWVIAKPETKVLRLRPDCEFLIMASDGLWDKVSNQEAVDVVRPLCIGIDTSKLSSACRKLIDLSLARGSCDDISVVLIQVGRFAL